MNRPKELTAAERQRRAAILEAFQKYFYQNHRGYPLPDGWYFFEHPLGTFKFMFSRRVLKVIPVIVLYDMNGTEIGSCRLKESEGVAIPDGIRVAS